MKRLVIFLGILVTQSTIGQNAKIDSTSIHNTGFIRLESSMTMSIPLGQSTANSQLGINTVATRRFAVSPEISVSYQTKSLIRSSNNNVQFRLGFGLLFSLAFIQENVSMNGHDSVYPYSEYPWLGRKEFSSKSRHQSQFLIFAYEQSFALSLRGNRLNTEFLLRGYVGAAPIIWLNVNKTETGILYSEESYSYAIDETDRLILTPDPDDLTNAGLHLIYGFDMRVSFEPKKFKGAYFITSIGIPLKSSWQNGTIYSDQLALPISVGVGFKFRNIKGRNK